MQHSDRRSRALPQTMASGLLALGLLCAGGMARAADVVVLGTTDFPESMTATTDGTLFFSSMAAASSESHRAPRRQASGSSKAATDCRRCWACSRREIQHSLRVLVGYDMGRHSGSGRRRPGRSRCLI